MFFWLKKKDCGITEKSTFLLPLKTERQRINRIEYVTFSAEDRKTAD